jgi:Protein of unknown function (DUF2283)
MKVQYDARTDTLVIFLREAKIRESDEVRPGVVADFGEWRVGALGGNGRIESGGSDAGNAV